MPFLDSAPPAPENGGKRDALSLLAEKAREREAAIAAWHERRFRHTVPFFYNSVDIRRAGFKMAPVDTNLFPAGFNNVSPSGRKKAAELTRRYLAENHPGARRVLLLAENHTRNLYYLENVRVLRDVLTDAGCDVRVTSLVAGETGEAYEAETAGGDRFAVVPFIAEEGGLRLKDEDWRADVLLVNNDLSGGVPSVLEDARIPIVPPLSYGWHTRRKSRHFEAYNAVAREFCALLEIDPWLVSAIHRKCGEVNFNEREGVACVARQVDRALYLVKEKYAEHGVAEEPYVFVKADNGTYGMGIMTVRSGEEMYDLPRTVRKKMSVVKEGAANSEVIIQEGVPTADRADGFPAEPMIYLVAGEPVGCIYRYNVERSDRDNLNSAGMRFRPMREGEPLCAVTGLVARLASYASAWECYEGNYAI
jgi:glutamate--cysteine ligase